MLKGQAFDVDIEFMGGTILFIAIALLMFVEILLPLMTVNYIMVSSEDDIKSVVSANLVKSRMAKRIGDESLDIGYSDLDSLEGNGLRSIGLSVIYVTVDDLFTGRKFEFEGKRATAKHDVYAAITSPYIAVMTQSKTVLAVGEEYILHIYKSGASANNILLDIYRDTSCDQPGDIMEKGSFRAIDCSVMPGLELMDSGVEINLKGMISQVRDSGKDLVVWVKPDSNIDAGDLVLVAMKLAGTWDCSDSDVPPYLCVRFAGDHRFPGKIHVEIKSDADIVSKVTE